MLQESVAEVSRDGIIVSSLMEGIMLQVLTTLLLAISTLSCGPFQGTSSCPNPPIHFVLPNGYSGAFRLELDEADGLDVKLEGGRYIYEIPAGGGSKLKDFQPLIGCHKVTAAYKNGEKIPYEDSSVSQDTVALRGGMGSGSREIDGKNIGPVILTYFIGTKEQEREFFSKSDSTPRYEETLPRR
jgi:hypothetical protein